MCTQLRCVKSGNERAFSEQALYPVVMRIIKGEEETAEILDDLGHMLDVIRVDKRIYFDSMSKSTFIVVPNQSGFNI